MKDKFISNLSQLFPNCSKRISIWAETDKYHWKEEESVWNQKKGNTAPQYEIHFDREFVCFLDSNNSESYNTSEFLLNIKKLYMQGKIFIHEEMYAVKEAELEEKNRPKEVEVPKPRSEAEDVIVQVVKKQAKRRGRKVKLK